MLGVSTVTGTQLRMARAGLELTVRQVAEIAGVNLNTVHRIERGHSAMHDTILKIQSALEAQGVEFIADGVRIPPRQP
ncbi:helix-turn-helix transcriptional regulator [Azospirillum sp. A26]|uniref:helix-turn-helix domain-containing protein n=1 Tax=Azospirillum sp. A26 TaxID=3160607 RepID=UPI00366C7CDF